MQGIQVGPLHFGRDKGMAVEAVSVRLRFFYLLLLHSANLISPQKERYAPATMCSVDRAVEGGS
jgi:hypothetical protein